MNLAGPAPASTPWRGAVMLGVAGLTPVVAYVGNLGFAPLIALAGLLCSALRRVPDGRASGVGLLLLLTLWAVASLAWTIHPPDPADFRKPSALESITALKLVLQLALYGAFVLAMRGLSAKSASKVGLTLAVGLSVLGVVLLAEAATGAAVYQAFRRAVGQATRPDWARRDVVRAAYIMALLFWPALLSLRRRGWTAAAGLTATGLVVGSLVLNVNTPIVALAAGGLAFLAVGRWGRRGLVLWLAGVAAYFLAAPFVVAWVAPLHPLSVDGAQIGKESWAARLDLWSFAAARIFERPWIGWGLDASRAFPAIPLHTHDLAIQLWLELGVVGAVLGALFFLWVGVLIDRLEETDRWAAAAAAATASAYLVIGALSFGAWQEWWLALGALALAACSALTIARRGQAAPA